jgi:putative Holliday junction resolvase
MRWIGVDPGTQNVGLAISDPNERLAVTLEVVPASAAVPAIRAIALREEAGGIVVGLPLRLDSSEGDAARGARRFGERLARVTGLPVEYEDEKLTSVEADRRTAGFAGDQPNDDVAAAILLQQFLDRRRAETEAREDPGDSV